MWWTVIHEFSAVSFQPRSGTVFWLLQVSNPSLDVLSVAFTIEALIYDDERQEDWENSGGRAMFYAYLDESLVGRLLVAGTDAGLKHVSFSQTHFSSPDVQPQPDWEENAAKLREPIRQLQAYFAGTLRQFDLPLAAEGTEFQRRVWAALCEIPFGETASYGDIARSVGNPAASRAVGLANGRNPIAIIVPCHRVIGRSGKLVGYGGGLDHKHTLLQHEGVLSPTLC
jgi:methylated-DNA-[protein]-cysteine S-methyltransferase